MKDLRYPLGMYEAPENPDAAQVNVWLDDIAALPQLLRAAVADLTAEQLATPYRPGGWTVKQVVHHIADSHMNSYIRFRLAMTEDKPVINAYDENAWAQLADYEQIPIEVSLNLIDSLHQRWHCFLSSLTPNDLQRAFVHPVSGPAKLLHTIGSYAWHGRHHVAHITELRQRQGW